MTVFGDNIFTYVVVTFNGIDSISYYEVEYRGEKYARATLNPETGWISLYLRSKDEKPELRVLVK
jgi:hypothetical protein